MNKIVTPPCPPVLLTWKFIYVGKDIVFILALRYFTYSIPKVATLVSILHHWYLHTFSGPPLWSKTMLYTLRFFYKNQ